MVLHKFNSPGYKKTGTFQSLSFLQSCLYIKDTQTKWNGPGYAGKRFACPYYTIPRSTPQESCFAFGETANQPSEKLGSMTGFVLIYSTASASSVLLHRKFLLFFTTARDLNCIKSSIPASGIWLADLSAA